jgi:hypothetical protein
MQGLAIKEAERKPTRYEDTKFLLSALRAAALRARLAATELDTVGIGLRQGLLDYDSAVAWLDDVNLLDHVIYRPADERQQRTA